MFSKQQTQMIANLLPAHGWLGIAMLQAVLSMVGSLYFSDIVGIPPCTLCWYQRIFWYPFVFMIPVAYYFKDKMIVWYGLVLAVVGWLIALYHNFVYYDEVFSLGMGESVAINCGSGVPCTSETINWFGFMTIPLLSLIGFTVLIAALWMYKERVDA